MDGNTRALLGQLLDPDEHPVGALQTSKKAIDDTIDIVEAFDSDVCRTCRGGTYHPRASHAEIEEEIREVSDGLSDIVFLQKVLSS